MDLCVDEKSISHGTGEIHINGIDNRKLFLEPTRRAHKILYATCELNTSFYDNYSLMTHKK